MSHKIVFLDRETLDANVRKPNFPHEYVEYAQTAQDQVVERLRDADICITNKVPLRENALKQLPGLKLIAVAATGTISSVILTIRYMISQDQLSALLAMAP